MTKTQVNQLADYRSRLRAYAKQPFFELMVEGGDFGQQKIIEMNTQKKRAIEIEMLNVQAYLSGYVHLGKDGGVHTYTKKYYALKD